MTHSVLASKAIEYKAMGIITLPVDRKSKRALIPYADLSLLKLTEAYIDSNFGAHAKADGLAILNGEKSGILTLDIDNPIFRTILKEEHPELLNTLTEKSPRGYHLIYRIADSDKNIIQGKRWQGIDLLWKNYVISAPTEGYLVVEDKAIKELSLIDYLKLCTFFDRHLGIIEEAQNIKQSWRHDTCETLTQSSKVIDYEKLELEKLAKNIIEKRTSKTFDTNTLVKKTILKSVYNQKRRRLERNESLFQTALYARDRGIYPHEVEEILHDIFMGDTIGKPYQSDKSRLGELQRTIKSAYSRPARPIQEYKTQSLTDNTREKIFQAKMTYLVRTWECLSQAGYLEDQKFTASEAVHDCIGIVGRDSVYSALKAVFPLSAPIPLTTDVAIKRCKDNTNKCIFVRDKKPVLTPNSGRPEYEYTFPSAERIAEIVGANDSTYCTLLTADDLSTAKNTRKKLQFSLVDRRPARYDLIWLADRLGLTIATIKTYHRELNIFSIPQFDETPLNQFNFESVFEDLPDRMGVFIMDVFGKKYPPLIGIAQRLLTKRIPCSLFIQAANYYTTRKPQLAPDLRPTHTKKIYTTRDVVQPKQTSKETPKQKDLPALNMPEAPTNEINKPNTSHSANPTLDRQGRSRANKFMARFSDDSDGDDFWSILEKAAEAREAARAKVNKEHEIIEIKPLPEKRDIAIRTVQNLIGNDLSERSIKRLIDLYGFKKVVSASQRVSKRDNVENPAGLLTIILRSEATVMMIFQF